jgi:hypothetical protein
MSSDLLALASDEVSAGPLGLLVVVLMMIATVLLVRNMNSRLRRLPREFPPPTADDRDDEDAPRS